MLAIVVFIANKVVTLKLTRAGAYVTPDKYQFTYIILLYRFMIYPEGKPGDNDNEHCWQVDCDDVE